MSMPVNIIPRSYTNVVETLKKNIKSNPELCVQDYNNLTHNFEQFEAASDSIRNRERLTDGSHNKPAGSGPQIFSLQFVPKAPHGKDCAEEKVQQSELNVSPVTIGFNK